MDLDQVVTREGVQLQTVGHHWPKSGPLPKETRDNMERVGVCLSCHKEIPTERFVYRIIAKIGSVTGLAPKTDAAHQNQNTENKSPIRDIMPIGIMNLWKVPLQTRYPQLKNARNCTKS
jgi:hypothetical protein